MLCWGVCELYDIVAILGLGDQSTALFRPLRDSGLGVVGFRVPVRIRAL